ncbi:DEAD/DEAH box helicase family protein [Levyella massiliensis]|uniref:DEAD/DEAH box helicase family protein n=1 Tax=Levyella massiliensis TaxID=938289 RepID=UPI0023EFAB9C|nr:DEAD/DEAH box helicase family protein [Levyella massiliensis]
MSESFLYEKLDTLKEINELAPMPDIIEHSLSRNIVLREYQKEAFQYFVTYFEKDGLRKNKQIHTLFHMATGSGKTVMMAGLILYLYTKGYRKFLFFVNQTNILKKTEENFLNTLSSKYLFADDLAYLGMKIKVKKVECFSDTVLNDDIELLFTTTQKLHMDMWFPKENAPTFADFENDKIVFISDESHHINSSTKKQTIAEEYDANNWEQTVNKAFRSNKDNILLEFTATADLKDKNVLAKYTDKIIYNYPLERFRASGYTKDFQNFATDTNLWDRTLIALILSEYRRYLFADLKLNIKPVIMLKSQKIKESEAFHDEFFKKLNQLTSYEIKALQSANIPLLSKAIAYFEEKDETLENLAHSLKNSFAEENTIIMNGSSDDNDTNQIKVNSLEDKDNHIRLIFAVDMLNEGWDVLNLFDIVRLYDTRQGSGKAGKIGSYTIKEAQLIGRGARYCPFVFNGDEDLKYKRKFDGDLTNDYRILETMLFHSLNDSRYIAELKQALIATGLQAENPIVREYRLKEEFKNSDFYQKSYVYSNERLPRGRADIKTIEPSLKTKIYRYTQKSVSGNVVNLFDEINTENSDGSTEINHSKTVLKALSFRKVDYNILSGAAACYPELRFDVIKEKYPNVSSLKEFLTSEDYLGNSTLEITQTGASLTGKDILEACKKAMNQIAGYVANIKQEFVGSREFKPRMLKSVLHDKKIFLSSIQGNGGHGESQNDCVNENYSLYLPDEQWYVFTDNYGTSEEKLFVKYFKTIIVPKLQSKNLEYYLVRNERIPELAIYSFDAGERFEPDFLLFIKKKDVSEIKSLQAYIEPKGSQLLLQDAWKEKFLSRIKDEHKITDILGHGYTILGLPFFNQENRMAEFSKAIDELVKKL